jgi:hypothetical protein
LEYDLKFSLRSMFEVVAIVAALLGGWGLASTHYREIADNANARRAETEHELRQYQEVHSVTKRLLDEVVAIQSRSLPPELHLGAVEAWPRLLEPVKEPISPYLKSKARTHQW